MNQVEQLIQDIFKYADDKGISIVALSNKMNIPKDRLYKWRRGSIPSDPDDWKKLQDYASTNLTNVPNSGTEENNQNTVHDDGGGTEHGKYQSKPPKEADAMAALFELASSNKLLAQAHDKQAEANKQQAEANRQLSEANKILALNATKLIENVGQQNAEAFEARFGALLELLKEVAQGQRYDGPGAVEARFLQIYHIQNQGFAKKNTQSEKGIRGK